MTKTWLRLFLLSVGFAIFVGGPLSVTSAQRKVFSHFTKAHRDGKYASCSSCHSMPTKNWMSARSDKEEPFPDTATFPSHTSCFGCHTKDIYSNGGAFCGTCHTVPTMRARAVQSFPVKSHATQFTTFFPHDVHQDIIASNVKKTDFAAGHFMLASFTPVDDKAPQFNNCTICHMTPTALPKYGDRPTKSVEQTGPAASSETFKPAAGFFKDMPDGHQSCFTCHYQGIKAPAADCASCHKLAEQPYKASTILQRYSLKFDHGDKTHAVKDCTICHVRITQNSDARTMRDADVPILACSTSSCHGAVNNKLPRTDDNYFASAIAHEIEDRQESKDKGTPLFQCTYCHAPSIGRFPVPKSHLNAVP
ncbi:MAG: cytochrome c3 family protein [Acidobacteriota bacterium]